MRVWNYAEVTFSYGAKRTLTLATQNTHKQPLYFTRIISLSYYRCCCVFRITVRMEIEQNLRRNWSWCGLACVHLKTQHRNCKEEVGDSALSWNELAPISLIFIRNPHYIILPTWYSPYFQRVLMSIKWEQFALKSAWVRWQILCGSVIAILFSLFIFTFLLQMLIVGWCLAIHLRVMSLTFTEMKRTCFYQLAYTEMES